MKSLDTNLILRLLLRDIPQQRHTVLALIDGAKLGSLAVADAVFFESVWILSGKTYNLDRELIGSLLLQVADIPQINCNRAMLERAIPLYVAHPKISFIDACLASYTELNGAVPLLTFDKKLVEALPHTVDNL